MTDPELETAIEDAKQALSSATDMLHAQAAWLRLKSLIEQRSSSQVRHMERGMARGR